jgi:PAS domain S-box-containing protein
MNKSILLRLGELNRDEKNSEFFILLKSFYEKNEHFKQYQSFLLDDISKIKNQVYKDADFEIDRLNVLFIVLPIIIFVISILLSIIIDKVIKNREKDLLSTKSLLENILNSIPIRVFWKDVQGKYIGANNLFLQDAKIDSKEEIIGKTDFELPWAKFEAQDYVDDDNYVKETKKPKLNIIETQTTPDGKFIHLNTSKVPLFDKDKNIIGVLGLYEDITQKS